jgi:mono/diheme cytochrome c family protein
MIWHKEDLMFEPYNWRTGSGMICALATQAWRVRSFGLALLLVANASQAADLQLDLGESQVLDTAALLARSDATTIAVPLDASYDQAMTYRAVPLRALLNVSALPAGQDLKLTAADGFITVLPAALIFPQTAPAAIPWLAIEPENQPWPKTPGGNVTGPFYLVWTDPQASGIMREQWPFAVVSIGLAPSASSRWPQLAVADDVPKDSLVHRGHDVIAAQCMVCHPVAGAGDAAVGPDLNLPFSPTEYFEPWAFRAYVREPSSLRSWDDMKMEGFGPDVLSDADLDAIIAYLDYLAARRGSVREARP